jgi:peroxiredoxin Q/BCP
MLNSLKNITCHFLCWLIAEARCATRYGALLDLGLVKFARRYTFLIDPEGNLNKMYLSVETSRHSKEIIDDLKQLTALDK